MKPFSFSSSNTIAEMSSPGFRLFIKLRFSFISRPSNTPVPAAPKSMKTVSRPTSNNWPVMISPSFGVLGDWASSPVITDFLGSAVDLADIYFLFSLFGHKNSI